ncbi:MAG: hypothetical protein ACRDPI_06160 [Nocardioidaceae bacterium]
MSTLLEQLAQQQSRELAERSRKGTFPTQWKPRGRHRWAHHLHQLADKIDG